MRTSPSSPRSCSISRTHTPKDVWFRCSKVVMISADSPAGYARMCRRSCVTPSKVLNRFPYERFSVDLKAQLTGARVFPLVTHLVGVRQTGAESLQGFGDSLLH